MHAALPAADKVPGTQGVHAALPAAEKAPSWQGVAEALPTGQKLPAGHGVQAALPPGESAPAAQAWQLQETGWLPGEQLGQPGSGLDVGWGVPVTTRAPATRAAWLRCVVLIAQSGT